MVNKTANIKEYRRQYHLANRVEDLVRQRERHHTKYNGYWNGELDSNARVGKGFISETIVANVLGLESGARCNCTANFNFKYDLLDSGGYGEINVKSSKLSGYNDWSFDFRNVYIPDTYILLAYSEDHIDIEHVWIIPTYVNIVLNKSGLTIRNSEKGLSRVREFEVDNTMYNIYLHTMSIDNCSVLKKPDFITEMLQ